MGRHPFFIAELRIFDLLNQVSSFFTLPLLLFLMRGCARNVVGMSAPLDGVICTSGAAGLLLSLVW